MKALITGASEGMGRAMAEQLAGMGYEIIAVARNEQNLADLKAALGEQTQTFALDLSDMANCFRLYDLVNTQDIDILINNAGFGVYGGFCESDLDAELTMLDLNVKALHLLTKLFLRDFVAKNKGTILNVASLAAFMPGPMHAGYYASKAYVLRLTLAIHEELRRRGSAVYVGAFCPGPVKTGFNRRAGAGFAVRGLACRPAADYAIKMMFRRKLVIVPDFAFKMTRLAAKLLPTKMMLRLTYATQMKRTVEEK